MTEKPLTSITVGDQATIAALATPPGRSAVAMIRISGPDARQIGTRLIAPMPETERHVQRSEIRNTNGQLLDDALVWYFEEPNSYTGEDVLEVTVHGGMIVPGAVLRAFIEAGARLAEPGEFTRRAVLNGKLDVLQAEAVGDLIDARSSAAHHQGLRQLGGALSDDLEMLRSRLLEVEAMLAYDIDFPEEDDGPIPRERVLAAGEALLHDLGRLLATSQRAEMIRDGALVVLAGAPNVGKSSLFNAMLGEVRAIVTDIAGTTRDAIEAVLDLPNIPLRLVDTAGLHETQDPIEVLGIETTSRYLEQATVILACVTPETAAHTVGVLGKHATSPIVVVGMKGDLVSKGYESAPDVIVSATTRNGLSALLAQVEHVLQEQHGVETGSTPALTRARHRVLVGEAELEVQQFLSVWRAGALPAPVAATHIHTAATALGELLGVIHVDDVLDVVFRSFCVGK